MATWRPKLLERLPAYDRQTLGADLVAGLTVGVVALPLAMAFGIASGATPQAGIYTAIVGGFLVALLGGSSIQVSGPTGAFVVIVSGIIAAHGVSGLLMVTMMAGVILMLLAVTGLGHAVKFIPRPVVIGFTNGIALLIATTQIKDFLGLAIPDPPSEFFARMEALARGLPHWNPAAVVLAAGSLALVLIVMAEVSPIACQRTRQRSSKRLSPVAPARGSATSRPQLGAGQDAHLVAPAAKGGSGGASLI